MAGEEFFDAFAGHDADVEHAQHQLAPAGAGTRSRALVENSKLHAGSSVLSLKELPEGVRAALSEFDTDGDGSIDVSEIQAAHTALTNARKKVRAEGWIDPLEVSEQAAVMFSNGMLSTPSPALTSPPRNTAPLLPTSFYRTLRRLSRRRGQYGRCRGAWHRLIRASPFCRNGRPSPSLTRFLGGTLMPRVSHSSASYHTRRSRTSHPSLAPARPL